MAIAEQLIAILDGFEPAAVREFIQRRGKSKRDLQLFNAIIQNPGAPPNELIMLLYGKPNRGAYKATQARLTE